MKFIHTVMADYIKSLVANKTEKTDFNKKDTTDDKKAVLSGMGDFVYEEITIDVENQKEIDHFDQISFKTKNLVTKIEDGLAEGFEENKFLQTRMNTFEHELLKRKSLYDICTFFCTDELREMEKYTEKIKRFEDAINHHEEVLDSWQCLINEFRKIPEECL